MSKMFLLFSHKLTEEQINEGREKLKIEEFIPLPEELQRLWSNIPPEGELNTNYCDPFESFIYSKAKEGDYILIQGEFGITYYMVNWSFANRFIPVYSTTKRVYKSSIDKNGLTQNIHIFKHVNFRRFPAAQFT